MLSEVVVKVSFFSPSYAITAFWYPIPAVAFGSSTFLLSMLTSVCPEAERAVLLSSRKALMASTLFTGVSQA